MYLVNGEAKAALVPSRRRLKQLGSTYVHLRSVLLIVFFLLNLMLSGTVLWRIVLDGFPNGS